MITENMLTECTLSKDQLLGLIGSTTAISAKVIRYDNNNKLIHCELSPNVFGIIPIDEFSTALKISTNIGTEIQYYPQLVTKIGKMVAVQIIGVCDTSPDLFILSRKKNIQYCYGKLKNLDKMKCEIVNITRNNLFVDCGMGVDGKIYISDAVKCYVKSLLDTTFEVGQVIECSILSTEDELSRIHLSFIKAHDIQYNVGDLVYGVVRENFGPNTDDRQSEASFFFEILPTHSSAVLKARPYDNLKYGDKVSCYVYKVKSNGQYKLKLNNKL